MPKLLIADDSVTTRKVVNLTFADEGIEVISAEDGDSALQLVSQHHPDIVLADVNMPGLNGYEVCEIIRKREESRTTPVVLLVGSFEPFDLEEARRVGATDYLTKPFSSIRRLVTTVSDLLAASGPASESASAAQEESQPEPDESLGDIDVLYSESFGETVEMSSVESERGDFGDPALDDELIEARFTPPESDEIGDQAVAEVPIEIEESAVASHESAESAKQAVADNQIAVDGSEEDNMAEAAAASASYSSPPEESEKSFATDVNDEGPIFEEPEPEPPFDEPPRAEAFYELESNTVETEPDRPESEAEVHQEEVAPPLEPPMPWDSVAAPKSGFEFDESDLLELSAASRQAVEEPAASKGDAESGLAVTPELVEMIVRKAAVRISEEFVRQIADRVVQQVVDEVLAEHGIEKVSRY